MTRGWRDATSYGRDERGKAEPTIWNLELFVDGATVTLSVHRWVGDNESWYGTCHDLRIDKEYMGLNLEDAKQRLLRACYWRASGIAQVLKGWVAP